MTPHLGAKKDQIAKVVLLAGDPLRAKLIAEKYLQDVKLVNEVRNMFYFTGTYKGKPVTVGGSGMGMPSMGIYSYELFNFYDVDAIIRIGTAGTYKKELDIFRLVNTKTAFSESNYGEIAADYKDPWIESTTELFDLLNVIAKEKNIDAYSGKVHCADVFYRSENHNSLEFAKEHDFDVVDMESYALFVNARKANKKAATLLTVSDSFITNESASAIERQTKFDEMVEVALEAAYKLS